MSASAEERLREACASVFANVGESLRKRLQEITDGIYEAASPGQRIEVIRFPENLRLGWRGERGLLDCAPLFASCSVGLYNSLSMANRAYLRIWTREFSHETMIAQLVRFLATVPLSAARNSFDQLTIQAIDLSETPVSEWDMREGTFGAPEVAAIAAQHINEDTAYIIEANWDLWSFDTEAMKWVNASAAAGITLPGLALRRRSRRRAKEILAWIWALNIFSRGTREF